VRCWGRYPSAQKLKCIDREDVRRAIAVLKEAAVQRAVEVSGYDDEGVKAGCLAARGNATADAKAKSAAASVGISTLGLSQCGDFHVGPKPPLYGRGLSFGQGRPEDPQYGGCRESCVVGSDRGGRDASARMAGSGKRRSLADLVGTIGSNISGASCGNRGLGVRRAQDDFEMGGPGS